MSVVLCCGAVLVLADEVQCKLNVRASGGDVAKFSQCAAKHTFLLDDFIRGMTMSLLEIGPAALLSFFFVFPLFRDWLGNVSLDGFVTICQVWELFNDCQDWCGLRESYSIVSLCDGDAQMMIANTFVSVAEFFHEGCDDFETQGFTCGDVGIVIGVQLEDHEVIFFGEDEEAGLVGRLLEAN